MTQPHVDITTTTLRIDRALWSRVRMRCLSESRSVNALMVSLLQEWEARTQSTPSTRRVQSIVQAQDADAFSMVRELTYSGDGE